MTISTEQQKPTAQMLFRIGNLRDPTRLMSAYSALNAIEGIEKVSRHTTTDGSFLDVAYDVNYNPHIIAKNIRQALSGFNINNTLSMIVK